MAAGERSLAVRLELLDFDSTLTEDRIDAASWQRPWRVWRRPGARLRA
jgi:phenylalanyl-tRNA synthetase beta chain